MKNLRRAPLIDQDLLRVCIRNDGAKELSTSPTEVPPHLREERRQSLRLNPGVEMATALDDSTVREAKEMTNQGMEFGVEDTEREVSAKNEGAWPHPLGGVRAEQRMG